MQINILWKGIEYNSLESCIINTDKETITIQSSIIGFYEDKIYNVDYTLLTNRQWQTRQLTLNAIVNGKTFYIELELNSANQWRLNGELQQEFNGCTDVDISLTPFTNSLPVNRLRLLVNDEKIISVIYIDVLQQTLQKVKQNYKRLTDSSYLYQNVPKNFEAEISVDENGFVIDYSTLFTRCAVIKKINESSKI